MTIGVLGGGQLGRILALAGVPLGMRFRFFDSSPDAPAGAVGEVHVGRFDDAGAVRSFADGLDLATYEFENLPADMVRGLAEKVPVYPDVAALEAGQDRIAEKGLFERLGIPVPPYAAVQTHAELRAAAKEVGLPAVLKTRRWGYDGKGQFILESQADIDRAWEARAGGSFILERFVPFDRELSILAVRGRRGETAYYPLVENTHRRGILRLSQAPARVDPALERSAQDYARRVLDALHYAGVLTIEFFEQGGRLLANEMAPRVHNSGHWTIEGATTSQFENHLRAICGLPLGDTRAVGHSTMVNLIGTLPPIEALCALPNAHVHVYGKSPRPERKLGHVTLWAADRRDIATCPEILREYLPA